MKVIPVQDSETSNYDIEAIPAIFQSQMYEGMSDVLCGKRGLDSYETATRAKRSSQSGFLCTQGKVACSTNIQAEGSTYCVDDVSECPVTKLSILDAQNLATLKLEQDRRYIIRESISKVDNEKIYVAFTKSAGESNEPLQQI